MERAGLSGRASLVERIERAIGPYKYNYTKPPFTPDELFTMVIAVKRQPPTKGQVLQWVFANFNYYKKMVEEEFVDDDPKELRSHSYWGRRQRPSDEFRTKISDVPRNFELYLKTESVQDGPERYAMTVASCERALSKALLPQPKTNMKAFRFLDLPPELRNTIFDLVFQYPRSGLVFLWKGQKSALVDSPTARGIQRWNIYDNLPKTARITDILAPLLVNKQFYEEAKACFFAINHFHFRDHYNMAKTLAKIPESQRRHIEHVTLDYGVDYYELRAAREAIALLATCGLKKLNLYLEEDQWKENGTTRRGRVYKNRSDVMNIPGLRELRAMRGLQEVNFYNCPTVEALIKADMLKPKPRPKKKETGGTKRKAEGESEGGKKSIRR
ncbi:hypothetical protein KC349_g2305 [Hortaea werneckii]|nr:hypothetical protein KC349_g2305 [Hortaea werneckii]